MGPVERKLTTVTSVIVFAAGIYVVIFAPFMVSDTDDGRHYIIDYSLTKGIDEAAIVAEDHCSEQGLEVSGLDRKRTYNRVQGTIGTRYYFTCEEKQS